MATGVEHPHLLVHAGKYHQAELRRTNLPADLIERVSSHAYEQDVTVSSIIEGALLRMFRQYSDGEAAAQIRAHGVKRSLE